MTISRRLLLGALTPALMMLVMAGGLVASYASSARLQRQQAFVEELALDTNELNDLARSYVETHADRPRLQFLAKQKEVVAHLESAEAREGPYQARLAPIDADTSLVGSLFARLEANYETRATVPPAVYTEAQDRLAGQLFIRLRDATGREAELATTISRDVLAAEQRISLLVAALTLAAAIGLTIGLLILRRSITRSLEVLGQGTDLIGSGDLDYRMAMTSRDELGDLGRSFDRMSERLRRVTVSRDELETEVEERSRAEADLREALATTSLLLKAAHNLAASVDPERVLQSLVDVLQEATGRNRIVVSLYDAETDEVVITAGAGDRVPRGDRLKVPSLAPETRETIEDRRAHLIDYDSPEIPSESRERAERLGYRLVLSLPLCVGDQFIGYIGVDDPGEHREFSEHEIEIAKGIASQAAIAIENARLFEAERAAQRQARLELETSSQLLASARTLAASVDLKTVLDQVARTAVGATALRRAFLDLWDEPGRAMVLAATAGESTAPVGTRFEWDKLTEPTKRSVMERRTIVADYDPRRKADKTSYVAGLDVRVGLIVPLLERSSVVGLLVVDDPGERHEFTPREVEVIEGIASQAATAIQNAQLFTESQNELARTNVLKEVATAAASLDLGTLAESVLETLQKLVGMRAGALYLLDEHTATLRDLGLTGYAPEVRGLFSRVPLDERSISAQAVLSDEVLTLSFDELPEDTRRRAEAAGDTDSQWVAVPVHAGGKPIGNFALTFPADRILDENDMGVLRTVSDQVGVALENARLHEETERELTRTKLLQDVALAASTSADLEMAANAALDALTRDMQLKGGDIRALSEGHLRLVTAFNYPPENVDLIRDVSVESSNLLGARAARENRVLTHEDEEATPERLKILERQGVTSDRYAYIPITYREDVLGVLSLTFPGRRPFTDAELSLFASVSQVLGQTMENARLFEAQQTRRQRVEALHGVMEIAVASLDLQGSAQRMLEFLVQQHGFELATVWLVKEGFLGLLASVGYPDGYRERFSPMPLTATFDAAKVFHSGEPIVAENTAEASPAVLSAYDEIGLRLGAYVILPLTARGTTIGTLQFGWHEPHPVNAFDLDFLESIAGEVGVVLENARLYEAEHDIADRLQGALLQVPDTLPHIEFAHAYHSATEAARVGGDFYDLFEIEDDQVGITIGDVAGKGLDASVLTSLVKNAIRAHANEAGARPAGILTLTNDLVFRSTSSEAFVTVFFAIVDAREGTIVYSNAGHTTSVISRPDGTIEKLGATAPLLGAFSGIHFDETEACLELDESLLLYTDGLTEARRDGELYGEERVFELLSKVRDGSPQKTIDRVLDDVLGFTGGKLNDDLALLALKRIAVEETQAPEAGHEI